MKKKVFLIIGIIVAVIAVIAILIAVIPTIFSKSIIGSGILENETWALRYAKTYFGEAELRRENTESSINSYTLADKEHGFEYSVYSGSRAASIDGTYLGINTSYSGSDFAEKYFDYIVDTLDDEVKELELKYNVKIESDSNWGGNYTFRNMISNQKYYKERKNKQCDPDLRAFYSVFGEDLDAKMLAGKELAELVKSIDDRGFFSNCVIWIRGTELNQRGLNTKIDSIQLK